MLAVLRARLFQPGPTAFAMLFALEALARASVTVVLAVVALKVLGSARDVSLVYAGATCVGLLTSQGIPLLIRRVGPGWTYAIAALCAAAVPFCLAASSTSGIAGAVVFRALAVSCGGNALQILILSHIERRDLATMEPRRVFFAAGVWSFGPSLGIALYENVAPWLAYGLSLSASALLLVHLAILRPSVPAARWATSGRTGFAPLRSIKRFFAQPRLRLAYVLNLARENWWSMFFVYVPIYAVTAGLGATEGGYILMGGSMMLFGVTWFGRLGRRIGMRYVLMGAFALASACLLLGAVVVAKPWAFVGLILLSAVAAVALDSSCMVTFQRAVRARERPEMTTIFMTYRDVAQLVSTAVFSLLLTFFGLWSVFAATGLWLAYCAWLSRWVPRGM